MTTSGGDQDRFHVYLHCTFAGTGHCDGRYSMAMVFVTNDQEAGMAIGHRIECLADHGGPCTGATEPAFHPSIRVNDGLRTALAR